jgi:hypothetical protein
MRIPTRDVPQADELSLVTRATEAVGQGLNTYQDIATAIGKYAERQGRYYRRAAELLGFIENLRGKNRAQLTAGGKKFLGATPDAQGVILANAVLSSRMIQRVLPFLEAHRSQGVSRAQLRDFIKEVTQPTSVSMLNRRLSSITSWLSEIGMLKRDGKAYFLQSLPQGIEIVDYQADDEPLLPRAYKLSEYQDTEHRVKKEIRNITLLVNEAARERARTSHRMLTRLVAGKLRAAGAIPRMNRLIDLSANLGDTPFVFEMKSTTIGSFHSQVRRAVAQLYEYRYIQQIQNPKLVVVTENPPPRDLEWMVNYLVEDRQILVAWDGDGKTLDCPPALKDQLDFLLQP